MIFKQALITYFLLLILQHSFVSSQDLHNPKCVPSTKMEAEYRSTRFLFFVDMLLDPDMLSRLQYLFKAISCEIPAVEEIKSLVMRYTKDQQVPGSDLRSDLLVNDLYREISSSESSSSSTPCDRFRRALGRVPPPFLEHESVHFMIPMIENSTTPGCFLKAFQDQFGDHLKKDSFFFDGILIDKHPNEWPKFRGTRLAIPDMKKAVNLSISDITASEKPSISPATLSMVQEYGTLIEAILGGKLIPNWEAIPTTTGLPTTSSKSTMTSTTVVSTTSEDPTTTTKGEIIIPRGIESSTSTVTSSSTTTESTTSESTTSQSTKSSTSQSSTTTSETFLVGDEVFDVSNSTEILSKRAMIIVTSSEPTTTSDEETTTLDRDYDIPEGGIGLDLASGGKDSDDKEKKKKDDGYDTIYRKVHVEDPPHMFEANHLIYILALLLLIWLFCIFICLIWMFRCAKRKKRKILTEAEEQQQLILPIFEHHPEPTAPKMSTESEEADDDWRNIKPAAYTAATASTQNTTRSEIENANQPSSNAQYAPVEVSEFEDPMDDDVYNRPRGYDLTAKRTAPLRFD